MKEAVKYFGDWQQRSVVSEKLEGPTGPMGLIYLIISN